MMISQPKQVWVLQRTVPWLFRAPKTYAKNYGQKILTIFALKIYVYLNQTCTVNDLKFLTLFLSVLNKKKLISGLKFTKCLSE